MAGRPDVDALNFWVLYPASEVPTYRLTGGQGGHLKVKALKAAKALPLRDYRCVLVIAHGL